MNRFNDFWMKTVETVQNRLISHFPQLKQWAKQYGLYSNDFSSKIKTFFRTCLSSDSYSIRSRIIQFLLGLLLLTNTLHAHEIRPAYLQIQQSSDSAYTFLWKVPLSGNKIPKIEPIFPSGFEYNLVEETRRSDALIKRYNASYTSPFGGKIIAIEGIKTTLVDVLVNIELLHDARYTFLLQASNPSIRIPVEPKAWEVAKLYLYLGVEHILIGYDHLLFVLGLVLIITGFRKLIWTITAFTLAHSITLALAALDLFSLPSAPVEAVIALSILFLAREYIALKEGADTLTHRQPWLVAFAFGLLHGFGFAGVLQEIGLPQQEIPLALLTFNLGVELGQLLFVLFILSLIKGLNFLPKIKQSIHWKIPAYCLGGIASFWLIERVLGFF